MRRGSSIALMVFALAIPMRANLPADLTDEQARQLAADPVAKIGSTTVGQLNTRRREDLEDTLFSFQIKIAGHTRKAAYFYNVVNGGYHITADEVTYANPTREWLVAVAAAGNATYCLEGWADADAAFHKLVSNVKVEIRNASQAEMFTRFYIDSVYGNANNIVYDELRLRHKVEEHFVGYAESQDAPSRKERRFEHWWAAFKARKVARLAPTVNADREYQYIVRLHILDLIVGRPPELWQWSVSVRSDGTTRLLEKTLVFQTSSAAARANGESADIR